MAIPSYDAYIKDQLTSLVDRILKCVGTKNETYVTDQALGDLEDGVKDMFKKAFGGTKPTHSITIDYDFPDNASNWEACFIINRGGADKEYKSIGNNLEQYGSWSTDVQVEPSAVSKDDQGYYLKMGSSISSVEDVYGLTQNLYQVNPEDNTRIDLSLSGDDLLDIPLKVTYYPMLAGNDSDHSGVAKGFSIPDTLNIYIISNNMDVLRCLDNILKFCLIVLRETGKGRYGINLPSYSADPVSLVDGTATPRDMPVFGIQVAIDYISTYSVNYDLIKTIQELRPENTNL